MLVSPVSLDEARQALLLAAPVLPAERVPLDESWQRVLAEEIIAPADYPGFDRSLMDGFAVRAGDVALAARDAPAVLRVVGAAYAGDAAGLEIAPGTASRIATGAPLPPGAGGVVRHEDAETRGEFAHIYAGQGADRNIARRGEDIRAGDLVLNRGTIINPGVISLLAALGHSTPLVRKRPRAAVLCTGSELTPLGEPLLPGRIYNSNLHMLRAMLRDAGAQPVFTAAVLDSEEAIRRAVLEVPDCDIFVTTGGACAGDRDLTEKTLRGLGVRIFFSRLDLKPGTASLAGEKDGKLYIGLSGSPSAAGVVFELLVRPVLLHLAGCANLERARVRAVLRNACRKAGPTPKCVWAVCARADDGFWAEALDGPGHGMLSSIARANALLRLPAGGPALEAGAEVEAIILGRGYPSLA